MAIKTIKPTKYVCSDGTEYIGGQNKSHAIAHENLLNNKKMKFDFEHTIAEIVNAHNFLSAIEDFEKEKEEGDHLYTSVFEAFDQGYYDDDFGDYISALFKEYTCPDDIFSFTDMAEIFVMIVDRFGGLEAAKKLYRFMKENG